MIDAKFNFKGWKTFKSVPDVCRESKYCRIMVDSPLSFMVQPSDAISIDVSGAIIEFRWNERTGYFEYL